jgi:hypothetical protein
VQIAVVDPDQRRFQQRRAVQFGLVMHLDQHVHAKVHRSRFQFGRLRVVSEAMISRMQSAFSARDWVT